MFKALKYLLFANLYKKAKKSFITLFGSIAIFIIFSFVMSDAISIASGATLYSLLIVKWIILLSLLVMITYSILKIFNIATSPFAESKDKTLSKPKVTKANRKKERILHKEKLYTKSDLILQKYMKD
jgi:uncharacterized protein YqhQ